MKKGCVAMEMCAGRDCWNEDSGGVCLACGCCSDDPLERCESRIAVLEERIFNLECQMREPHKEFSFERDGWVRAAYDYETPRHLIAKYEQQIAYYEGVRRKLMRQMERRERDSVPVYVPA